VKGLRCGKKKCVPTVTNFHAAVDPVLNFNYDTSLWGFHKDLLNKTFLFAESK
jgi:hypothetical protein